MPTRRRTLWIAGAFVTATVAVGLVLGLTSTGMAAKQRPTRDIFLTAVEWKGSASVAKEAYPGVRSLPCAGDGCGYESFAPGTDEMAGDASKWAIETYRFDSATVVAYEGERVTLNIFGVNAKYHDIVIPAFKKQFRVNRGVLSKVTLNVDKAGIYKITCITHPPAHQADLVVLPKP
jgi:plastocyanin